MSNPELTHQHNPEIEGPLPQGFPDLGREGKVRNVYINEAEGTICLIASDRVSAFDQVSPTPIPGKGEILNDIASRELVAAEEIGIPTWFDVVPVDNPRAAIGTLAKVIPIEFIFRNYMTGSMWDEYKRTGGFQGFNLGSDLKEWTDFGPALFTPSTKGKKDDNFNPRDVERITNGLVTPDTLRDLEQIARELFDLGTLRAANRGLVLVDTKYEMGVDQEGRPMIIDEVHTPDSSRFVLAEGFADAVRAGKEPKAFSKQVLRDIMLERTGGDRDKAKALMALPLDPELVELTLERYHELHQRMTS